MERLFRRLKMLLPRPHSTLYATRSGLVYQTCVLWLGREFAEERVVVRDEGGRR